MYEVNTQYPLQFLPFIARNKLRIYILEEISIKESNRFSISHLGTVNNQKKLLIHQSNNLIIDVNIQDLEDTYKNSIYKKISK